VANLRRESLASNQTPTKSKFGMRTPVTGSIRMVGTTEVILGLAVRTQMKLGYRNDFKALIKMHLNGGGGSWIKALC
jgi:hypothetical protein